MTRFRFHDPVVADFFTNPGQDTITDIPVNIFPSAEDHRRLDLHTLAQKTRNVILLELVIVFVGLGPELDLFDLNDSSAPKSKNEPKYGPTAL